MPGAPEIGHLAKKKHWFSVVFGDFCTFFLILSNFPHTRYRKLPHGTAPNRRANISEVSSTCKTLFPAWNRFAGFEIWQNLRILLKAEFQTICEIEWLMFFINNIILIRYGNIKLLKLILFWLMLVHNFQLLVHFHLLFVLIFAQQLFKLRFWPKLDGHEFVFFERHLF